MSGGIGLGRGVVRRWAFPGLYVDARAEGLLLEAAGMDGVAGGAAVPVPVGVDADVDAADDDSGGGAGGRRRGRAFAAGGVAAGSRVGGAEGAVHEGRTSRRSCGGERSAAGDSMADPSFVICGRSALKFLYGPTSQFLSSPPFFRKGVACVV